MGVPTWHHITLQHLGQTTLWLNIHFALRIRNSRRITTYLTKTCALSTKTCCGEIPYPTGPQHKHCDSALSHSVGVVMLMRSPSNWSQTAQRSTTHCSMVCCTYCMHSSEANLSGANPYLSVYISYICVSLPSISAWWWRPCQCMVGRTLWELPFFVMLHPHAPSVP